MKNIYIIFKNTKFFSFCIKVIKRLLIPNSVQNLVIKNDISNFYNDITGYPHGEVNDLDKLDHDLLQWVIPNFGRGSGGHLNIFRYINILSKKGYKNHIVIIGEHSWKSEINALNAIKEYYFPIDATIGFGPKSFRASKTTFATGWQTAYWVKKHQASQKKFYFVQDFEPFFYPVSYMSVLAENTYKLGLYGITAGTWLKDKLHKDYHMKSEALSFSFDKDLYKPAIKKNNKNFNILFYSRHSSPRRMFELGLIALEKLTTKYKDTAVIFVGGDVSNYKINFHHLNPGVLDLKELPDLYSQCDLSLVLSGTNLSLLPLEIAACKCPLVINKEPYANWLLPDNSVFYCEMNPVSIFDQLERAYLNKNERELFSKKAYDFAMKTSWDNEVEKLIQVIEKK